jgi:glycosyltransferase involved in cell wall biosynthesis
MSADPTTLLRPVAPAPNSVERSSPERSFVTPGPVPGAAAPARAGAREGLVRVLQLGPDLAVRGGVSSVEQLICDFLTPYANLRHVPTMNEGNWLQRSVTFARACAALWRELDTVEPTVVHIHFSSRGSTLRKMLLAQMVIRARRPLILHAHGGSFDRFHRGLPAPLRTLVSRTLQQANMLIALSSQWRDFYIRECELAPSQVAVLPNPVRVPARVPDRAGRSVVQFVHLGKLGRTKGSFDLVHAFLGLPPALRARARLVLAGNGDVEAVRALAAAEPRVSVLPWIDAAERDRLLAESDVFVLPSYIEGVPMSLLEAMAAGLPSITTPVGGIPDVFSHGLEGSLVRPGDCTQLTAALAQYIQDEPLRLSAGTRAYERARTFDVHAYARRLAEIYQRIAPVADIKESP